MFGSNFVIVERLEESVFLKFARCFLLENGFTNVYQIIRKTAIGANFIAVKKKKEYVVRVEFGTAIKEISDVEKIIGFKQHYNAETSIIFTRQEFSEEIIAYLKENKCEVITKIEIENWLNSKYLSCLDFIDYLELKEIRKLSKYSAKDLIKKYYDLKEVIGRQPSLTDINRNMDISSGTYSHRWGTYRNFIASINDNPVVRFSRPNKSMTASVSELIESYLKLRKKFKRPPSTNEIDTSGKYTHEYYSFFFGTWSNFVMVVENEINNALKYKKKELIKEYHSIQKIVKRPPTFDDVNKKSKISPIIFLYHWDTWNDFLKSIGEKKQYRNINDKELVLAYFDLKEKLNKTPSQIDFMKNCSISHDTFEYRFGNWNNFVELLQHEEFINPKPNDVDLISDYYRIKKILNTDSLTLHDIKRHSQFSVNDYTEHYGSWKSFSQLINQIEVKSYLISEEELINEYLRLLSELKKPWLTIYDIKYHGLYSYPIYLAKFQSWVNVIVLMRNYVGKIKHPKQITNQQLIDDYYRVEKQLNKSPLFISDYEKYGKYSEANIGIRFGSWKKFLRTIGQKSVLEITKEELIKDYFRVKKKLNKKVVFRREYEKHGKYSDTAIRNRFGKWSLFLNSIGEDTSHIKKISREILIEDYRRVQKLLGKNKINQTVMQQYGKFTRRTYSKYFGGWDKFLEFMGEDTSKKRFTDQEMIDEYYRIQKQLNKTHVSIIDMNEYAGISGTSYQLRFGSWKNFLYKIGEDTEYIRPITDEDLKAEYLRIKKELKKPKLIMNDIKKYGKYKSKAYFNHFGSWDNFVRLMGDGNSKNLNTDQEVIDEYWRVKKLLGKNYITQHDMNEHGKLSSTLYNWRFGSWKSFLKLIGEESDFRKAKKAEKN